MYNISRDEKWQYDGLQLDEKLEEKEKDRKEEEGGKQANITQKTESLEWERISDFRTNEVESDT